jgi:RND family efflux transporter MFP subunit
MKSIILRRAAILLPLAALVSFAIYQMKFRPLPVHAHTVTIGEIIAEVMGTGTLEARVKTTVSPRIQERLAEVLVDQGDSVKAGQLLARLDDAEVKQQVAIAESSLAAAKQTLERVRADLARSEAVLTQARLNQTRLANLASTQAVSQSDADKASEALAVAEADMRRSQATISEAEAQTVVAEKNLLFRREQLAFTQIKAPYDGLIIRRDRDPGDIVVPGSSLMHIISNNELWISAWVDETAMPALAPDQAARIVFRSEPARGYPGKVARLGREADRETREFLVDVRVSELPQNWAIGQRAEVFIETGREADVVLLPAEFLMRKDGRAGVFVNSGGKARWRAVTPGMRGRDLISITHGLKAGDQVLKLPAGAKKNLSNGQRVKLP